MSELAIQMVPIQHVLANVSTELFALGERLRFVEKLLFDGEDLQVQPHRRGLNEMQDIDLIIQQICDLGRAIGCVAEAELAGLSLRSGDLGDRLHLNDLRQRLLGLSEQGLLDAPGPSRDIFFF